MITATKSPAPAPSLGLEIDWDYSPERELQLQREALLRLLRAKLERRERDALRVHKITARVPGAKPLSLEQIRGHAILGARVDESAFPALEKHFDQLLERGADIQFRLHGGFGQASYSVDPRYTQPAPSPFQPPDPTPAAATGLTIDALNDAGGALLPALERSWQIDRERQRRELERRELDSRLERQQRLSQQRHLAAIAAKNQVHIEDNQLERARLMVSDLSREGLSITAALDQVLEYYRGAQATPPRGP